ncbi:uncharacterized protein A4U43_C05F18440 [Asparagus officinalis]|uniref:CN hydrolase domain-containing protein n=2 Tax=Asparagus officinalis TaxID=4686 RepID=A0A5P1EWF6_ASPOF|nr:uncharacterized protein A4U43_C05F18440 [Asparagus officinalis]
MRQLTVATCNLNQWAMDFDDDMKNIKESIFRAKKQGAVIRIGPELEITGYGCEDHFLEQDTVVHSFPVVSSDEGFNPAYFSISCQLDQKVRMKVCCVLESILRKKDNEHLSIIASYFSERRESVVKYSDVPQVSLREKANKVLSLLDGDKIFGTGNQVEQSNTRPMPVPAVQMPDLIDTSDANDYGTESLTQKHVDQNIGNLTTSGSLVDDLFGDGPVAGLNSSENRSKDDPFADVSFHVTEEKQLDDIFSRLTVDVNKSENEQKVNKEFGLLDAFSSNSDLLLQESETKTSNDHDLMTGLSLNSNVLEKNQPFIRTSFVDTINLSSQMPTNQSSQGTVSSALNGGLGSNSLFPMAAIQYNMPQTMMFNPSYTNQPMNYAAIGAFIAQQQLLFQNVGNINAGYGHAVDGSHSALPDIFQLSKNPVQNHATTLTSSKEDTKAFDFILVLGAGCWSCRMLLYSRLQLIDKE